MTTAAAGPVVIGFDGSPAAERAIRESAPLLHDYPALVVTVWEAGRAYDLTTLPIGMLEPPPVALDMRTAAEAEAQQRDLMVHTAQRGAQLARDAGFTSATGLAVAEDTSIADTLIRVAAERHSPGLIVGSHGHGRLSEFLLGSTSRSLVDHAPCPVVVTGPHRP
ncbi:universal stress protein [Dactylosporangium sp. CA-092794]|uniref:universal stress protein n=1 Tax=Dactylosporangium sp. CA-092794 TaxID=3239929 RepID=UPI003D93DD7C